MWRGQVAALVLLSALDRELSFWGDMLNVKGSDAPVEEAWRRASRYGPGPRGLYGSRRLTIARGLLTAAVAAPLRARAALIGLSAAATFESHDGRGDRGTYRIGHTFVAPLERAADLVIASRTGQDPRGGNARDVRTLFDLASPVILSNRNLPLAWEDDLDDVHDWHQQMAPMTMPDELRNAA